MKSETAQGYERGTMLLPGAVSQTGRNSNFRLDSLIRVTISILSLNLFDDVQI